MFKGGRLNVSLMAGAFFHLLRVGESLDWIEDIPNSTNDSAVVEIIRNVKHEAAKEDTDYERNLEPPPSKLKFANYKIQRLEEQIQQLRKQVERNRSLLNSHPT